MNQRDKNIAYIGLVISLICAILVCGGCYDFVLGFPGAETLNLVSVSDMRTNPSQNVLWNISVLNNSTFWVNITLNYNGTAHGPYNVTLTAPQNAVFNDTAPSTYGNYTVNILTKGATANDTLVGFLVDHYMINLDASYTEIEAGFTVLINAIGESVLDGHQIDENDTLTVEGIAMTWNTPMSYFYGTETETTPQTNLYDNVTSFLEDTYGITSATINTTVTVTWTTSTLDNLYTWFGSGNWIGGIMDEAFGTVTVLGGYSIILGIFSLAAYQSSGPYAVFGIWIFGWSILAPFVHGTALGVAVIMLSLGIGLAIAKLYLDRRTT